MSYDNNDVDYEPAQPKKADVLIKSTQTIVAKQEELLEQTRLAVSRIDEAIDLCHRNSEEASYILDHSTEMFEKLQTENSRLKQDLLYLAKQSENIYVGLADKLNELQGDGGQSVESKPVESKFDESRSDEKYYELSDRLAEIYARLEEMTARIDALSSKSADDELNLKLNDKFAILYDKIDSVSSKTANDGANSKLGDKLAVLCDKVDALSSKTANDGANSKLGDKLAVLCDKVDALAAESAKPLHTHGLSDADGDAILDKLGRISDNLRKTEGAHSMLADKFEILSMRVEQFGFESSKTQPQGMSAFVPSAQSAVAVAEIDYDKLAAKVADILSVREAVSPDHIASKVAEQIVLPEQSASGDIDVKKLAAELAALIKVKPADSDELADKLAERVGEIVAENRTAPVDGDELADRISEKLGEVAVSSAPDRLDEEGLANRIVEKLNLPVADESAHAERVEIDEEGLANRIVEKFNLSIADERVRAEIDEEGLANRIAERLSVAEKQSVPAALEFDEEALADKIASRLSGLVAELAPANTEVGIDEEDLADAIALKVGSLKSDEFEILVDDAGCASISKEIAEKLDYRAISEVIADKLREILELNAANAPDYEDMAERISEKITVAGINEDAIADKAAAVLSNYLPEFDTEEIADKVTGAVIDVVSAMPQPVLDGETICNEICERLLERREDDNYDIVIDDDGISRITSIVADEVARDSAERFDKLEESIARLSERLTAVGRTEELERAEEGERVEEVSEERRGEATSLSEIVATEIERGTANRFDKVEEGIARLCELVSDIVAEEEEYCEEEPKKAEAEEEIVESELSEEEYESLSDILTRMEENISARLDGVEEKISSISECIVDAEEIEGLADDELSEEEYENLSDILTRIEEKISSISECIIETEEGDEELVEGELSEEEYETLSDILTRMEENISARLDGVEEKISSISECIVDEEEGEEELAEGEPAEEEYENLSDILTRMEESISARFDGVEEKISSINERIADAAEGEEEECADGEPYAEKSADDEYAKLSKIVSSRFDEVEERISGLTELLAGEAVEERVPALKEVAEEDYAKLSEIVSAELEKGLSARFDGVEEGIARIAAIVGGITVAGVAADGATALTDARVLEQLDKVAEDVRKISEYVQGDVPVTVNERLDRISGEIAAVSRLVEGEISIETNARLDRLLEEIERLSGAPAGGDDGKEILARVEGGFDAIKGMLASGAASAAASAEETAAAQTAEVEEEPEELVTVSDIVKLDEESEEEEDDDFLLSAIDMDKFSDDERMPGEFGDLDGVDFENMMKFNRSFIARIIQSDDECKQYYGAVKHALLSYKKVNSNVAWGNERFNKGRETIARMKIRGKTLVIYLALDPNEYKTSVYHHADVSDNKSVLGTPMMIKVKSPLGVRKAVRLIDEMLAKRNGEKRELPERDYAAMYPYETIEELIEDGLVKDVRKK